MTSRSTAIANSMGVSPLRYLRFIFVAFMIPVALTLSFDTANSQPPIKYDSGLSVPFEGPDPVSGKRISILDYGATSNQPSNDDAVAIQKAIKAAAPGDEVYIPDGIYHVKTIVHLKSGVLLLGQSKDQSILACAFSTAPHSVIYAAPGVSNLTVSSFRITVATGKFFHAGVRLGAAGNVQVSRITIRKLKIDKHQKFGIQLQNAYHTLIESNTISNASALGGGGSGYGIIIDQSKSNNNWVRGNAIGPVIRHAILLQYYTHHNLIEGNTVTGAVSGAIDLHGEDEYSNEIRYNRVSDCVRNGTSVSPNGGGIEIGEFSGWIGSVFSHDNSGRYNWIHHNIVSNCTYGIFITNNSNFTYVEDNEFRNNVKSGITADLAPLNNLIIRRNKIVDNGNGVILNNVRKAVVQENTISSNRGYGIWTNWGSTSYTITDNAINGNKVDVALGSRNGVMR